MKGVSEQRVAPGRTIGRKIRPPAIAARVEPRPRLATLLESLLECSRVVLVVGTAGSGKTTAVAEALEQGGREYAWLTVDSPDSSPGRMIAYLEASLSTVIPSLAGRGTKSLADGFSHREAAGLLADGAEGHEFVLVIDDLERLDRDSESWAALSSFLRFAPSSLRTVLVSRRSMPPMCELPAPPEVSCLSEEQLAFTSAEAAGALDRCGRSVSDPNEVVRVTGGWVTGVLFEAWRSADHVAGQGGEVDPLFGYLGRHILSQLEPAQRELLVKTSLLAEVSAEKAEALGIADAAQTLRKLREWELPVSWGGCDATTTMRCHPRFREYLMALFQRGPESDLREARIAIGELLVDQHLFEEATEEFLLAGAFELAADSAQHAIMSVVERADLGQARRWLSDIDLEGAPRPRNFAIAELMIFWAEQDYFGVERVADELADRGERDPLALRSSRAAALMAWVYFMRGRYREAEHLIAIGSGREIEAVGYLVGGASKRPPRPELSGGPFDLFVLFTACYYGESVGRIPEANSAWANSVRTAWEIAVLRYKGRTQQALNEYERAVATGSTPSEMLTYMIAEVCVDAGDPKRARSAIAAAKGRLVRIGAVAFEAFLSLAEAKLALRLEGDCEAARASLESIDEETYGRGWLYQGAIDVWWALIELREGKDSAALSRLRRTVPKMQEVGHFEYPTAAVFLAEAEWRAGNEEDSDRAADLALEAAASQGSNHMLLMALGDFPAVAARRSDAEHESDSPWHGLCRALMDQGAVSRPEPPGAVVVAEFGQLTLYVRDEVIRPPLKKCGECLALLASRDGQKATRAELLRSMFDGRDDRSTRSYLRQIIHQLRLVLPEGTIETDGDFVLISDRTSVKSESAELLAALTEAARLRGRERVDATEVALAVVEQGVYLPDHSAEWSDSRRREIEARCQDARLEAAKVAFELSDFRRSKRLCERVVDEDPFRESAFQLMIRLAAAVGDEDAALSAYRRCEAELAKVAASPSAETLAYLPRSLASSAAAANGGS